MDDDLVSATLLACASVAFLLYVVTGHAFLLILIALGWAAVLHRLWGDAAWRGR